MQASTIKPARSNAGTRHDNGQPLRDDKIDIPTDNLLSTLDHHGCGVITVNTTGEITYINDFALKLTGWTAVEALGQNLTLVFNITLAKGLQASSLIQHALLLKAPYYPEEITTLTSLSGTKQTLKYGATPLFDSDASPTGVMISFTDVSQIRELEETVTRIDYAFQSVIDNFPLPVATMDLHGNLTVTNQAFSVLFGQHSAGASNGSREISAALPQAALNIEKDQAVLRSGSPIKYELNLPHTNSGKCIATKFPILDEAGTINGIGFICNKLIEIDQDVSNSAIQEETKAGNNDEKPDSNLSLPSFRVVVVDDDPQMRSLTKEMLEIANFEVLSSENGEQALQLLKKDPSSIDLLITDIMMPEMDGYQLTEKALTIKPELKVLLASGFNSYLDDEHPFNALPQISKPFSSQKLLDAVFSLLNTKLG